MNWNLWWVFVATNLVLDATPGPAVMLVIGTSMRHGWRAAMRTVLGILSANSFYFAISATSVGALLLASYDVFFLVKWLGAAYLVWLGWKALRSRESFLANSAGASARRLYLDGVATQIANPKALVYFGAFVPLFLDRNLPVAPQLLILGGTSVFFEFFVLLGYAVLAGRAVALVRQPRYAAWTNRVSGVVLIGAGGGMALLRR